MGDFIPHPGSIVLVKLSGTIRNLRVTRAHASFVFTESDQTRMGVVAIAAAAAGLSGRAVATASYASSMEEDADYVEFELEDKPVKGWVWRNPFKEGDNVEVAAEWHGDHYEAFGIIRPIDKTIGLYPHCSRGRITHIRNAVKWWLIGGGSFLFFVIALGQILSDGQALSRLIQENVLAYGAIWIMSFFGLMTFSLTRQWLPFVRLSEKVFRALGLPNPSKIGLVKSSKAQRTNSDPGEYGTFYFRH